MSRPEKCLHPGCVRQLAALARASPSLWRSTCLGKRRWCLHSILLPLTLTGWQVASLSRDKFLVTAVLLDREDIPAPQLADALRTQTPDGQYRSPELIIMFSQMSWYWSFNRLRCNLAGAPETGSGIGQVYASPPPATAPEDPARQVVCCWESRPESECLEFDFVFS